MIKRDRDLCNKIWWFVGDENEIEWAKLTQLSSQISPEWYFDEEFDVLRYMLELCERIWAEFVFDDEKKKKNWRVRGKYDEQIEAWEVYEKYFADSVICFRLSKV